MRNYIPTKNHSLDKLLGGGFPFKKLSLVYGEAETGKTSLAVQCAINTARNGYKSFFMDTDGTFSYERLSQIAQNDHQRISPLMIITKPTNFQEQATTIDNLEKIITNKFGLIIIDTITSLYRLEFNDQKGTFLANRELNRQLAVLTQIVKTFRVAALIISQVSGIPINNNLEMKPVATRVLNYWSEVVLNVKKTSQTRVMKILREKHPTIKGKNSCYIKIESTGINDFKH